MEHTQEILALYEVIEAIEEEIELAEEHLDCAMKLGHRPELALMFIESADMKAKMAERFIDNKQKHVANLKATGKNEEHPHKSVCEMWCLKHPELCSDLDGVKYSIQAHKARMSSNPRTY